MTDIKKIKSLTRISREADRTNLGIRKKAEVEKLKE